MTGEHKDLALRGTLVIWLLSSVVLDWRDMLLGFYLYVCVCAQLLSVLYDTLLNTMQDGLEIA